MACSSSDLEKLSALAKQEIGEADVNLDELALKLRELIAEKYTDLRLPPDADNLLHRSLRCKKFNLDQSAKQVHLFFKLLADLQARQKNSLFVPSILQEHYFESYGLAVLKQRDSKGRIVVLKNYERLAAKNYRFDNGLAANIMLMDELTKISTDTQRIGVVYVCYYKGFQFGHATQYSLSKAQAMTKFIQGSFPVRFKGFHVVGSPRIFQYVFALFRPFVREKIKSRVFVHGSELAQFHEHVSPDILPDFLGGKLSYEESVDFDLTRRLAGKDDYYKELLKYGYMTNSTLQH